MSSTLTQRTTLYNIMTYSITNKVTTIKQCKHGTFVFFNSDAPIGHCLDVYGEWAEPELQFIKPYLKDTTHVIDVGANIGTHTVFFAKNCKNGLIHAFEPQYYINQVLTSNVVLNNCFNVKTYHAAVSNDFESLKLMNFPPFSEKNINYGEFKIHNHKDGYDTPCVKLDTITKADFIKIDVEGHEVSVIKSGLNLIQQCKPMMYIEFNSEQGNPELLSLLEELGYVCYWHVYEKFSPVNHNNISVNIWLEYSQQHLKPSIELMSKFFEGNIFCVHKSQKIKKPKTEKVLDINDNLTNYILRKGLVD